MVWHKYKAVRTNGFASKLESSCYDMLKLMERAGELSDIKCQQAVLLTRANITCKIDFSAVENKTGALVYIESKGAITDRWIIIKRLWKVYGPGKLYIYGGSYQKPRLLEVIEPIA